MFLVEVKEYFGGWKMILIQYMNISLLKEFCLGNMKYSFRLGVGRVIDRLLA